MPRSKTVRNWEKEHNIQLEQDVQSGNATNISVPKEKSVTSKGGDVAEITELTMSDLEDDQDTECIA